jgi:RNA polymerase II subunit A-like phosphatase
MDEIAMESATPPPISPTKDELTTTPPNSPGASKGKEREINPNAEALKDVASFQLEDDLPPGYNPRGKLKVEARRYYTKPR